MRGLRSSGRLWSEDKVDFEGVHYHLSGASIIAKAGAARSADVDRRLVRGGDQAHRALWHRLAGRRRKRRPRSDRSSPASAHAAAAEGRAIDDDHYGAGIPFRFGRADDPGLGRLFDAYRKRTGRDPLRYFAIGDAAAIVERIAAYVAAGISKFILRPAARGDDDIMAQTRRLIEEVLPLVAARWPKSAKRTGAELATRGAA